MWYLPQFNPPGRLQILTQGDLGTIVVNPMIPYFSIALSEPFTPNLGLLDTQGTLMVRAPKVVAAACSGGQFRV